MDNVFKVLDLNPKHNALNYFYLSILLVVTFLAISIFNDILQIHIYRHDSIYYMAHSHYSGKVSSEGRWLNYVLFPFTTAIPGNFWAIFILCSFACFIFVSAYEWTSNTFYSLLLALLFLQIPSFPDLITWPATAAPAFFVLLLSIYGATRLPVFIFYAVFGIMFFATMSNYYYLLPLLHLGMLSKGTTKEITETFFLKLLPAWAIGFIAGYAFTHLVVYVWFGHFIKLASWRKPHYIHSFSDLVHNIWLSFHALQQHIKNIFSTDLLMVASIAGLVISFLRRKNGRILYPTILFIAITVIHYITVIPVGIVISPRTLVATWVGVLTILFFVPSIEPWKVFLLIPVILLFTYNLYLRNHHNLQWYGTIMNTHYNMLIKISPKPPAMYEGVVLFADDGEVHAKNQSILKYYNLTPDGYIEGLSSFYRWAPIAKEAGFKSVNNCNYSNHSSFCQELENNFITSRFLIEETPGFFNIIGEYNNFLVLSFDNKEVIRKTREQIDCGGR